MFAVSLHASPTVAPAHRPGPRRQRHFPGTVPWRALRCTLLAAVCCWLSQSIIRQAHVRYLVSRATALSSGVGAADQTKAEAALRQVRRLAPDQAEVAARRRSLASELSSAADLAPTVCVTEDISRRLLLARGEPTGEDRALWEN